MSTAGEEKAKKATTKGIKKVGKYVVDFSKRLGSGQFGEVYVAESQQTKETYAAKVINKQQIIQDDSYSKNALVRQIEIMKNLKSINIIQFVQVIETANNLYIFQQLANQGCLSDLLSQKKRFTEEVAVGYILQILNGFTQLISHGIIHRDIKATNILIKDNKLKIADFGMSRYSSKSTAMQSYVGTPYYMAPQIIQCQKYTYKCDIWSLGVLFYELVVGNVPWVTNANNVKSLLNSIRQQCKNGVQFPEKLGISEAYKHLVRGCLKYNEEQRMDWTQIFSHKLFLGKIKQINTNFQNFTMTELRKKIHSNNVNLQKLLTKLPQKLNKQDFSILLKYLNEEINEKQIQKLFSSYSKGKDFITKAFIIQLFQDYGITKSCLKGKYNPQSQKNDSTKLLFGILSKNIEEKNINLFELYRKFHNKKQNRIDFEHFSELILSISDTIKKEEIQFLFKLFNTENTKTIPFQSFYENFCKAVQIPALKDSKVSEGIKKMQERKGKQ